MRKVPIEIQSFREICESKAYYVDKTKVIDESFLSAPSGPLLHKTP